MIWLVLFYAIGLAILLILGIISLIASIFCLKKGGKNYLLVSGQIIDMKSLANKYIYLIRSSVNGVVFDYQINDLSGVRNRGDVIKLLVNKQNLSCAKSGELSTARRVWGIILMILGILFILAFIVLLIVMLVDLNSYTPW